MRIQRRLPACWAPSLDSATASRHTDGCDDTRTRSAGDPPLINRERRSESLAWILLRTLSERTPDVTLTVHRGGRRGRRRSAPIGRQRWAWWRAVLRRLYLAVSGWTVIEGGRAERLPGRGV